MSLVKQMFWHRLIFYIYLFSVCVCVYVCGCMYAMEHGRSQDNLRDAIQAWWQAPLLTELASLLATLVFLNGIPCKHFLTLLNILQFPSRLLCNIT